MDYQLAASSGNCMLMIQYLGVDPPFTPFYREGLAALNVAARALHKLPFVELKDAPADALVDALAEGKIEGWTGPASAALLFCGAQRRVRCHLWHRAGLRGSWRSLCGAHHAAE